MSLYPKINNSQLFVSNFFNKETSHELRRKINLEMRPVLVAKSSCNSITWTKMGITLSPRITARLCDSRAKMCRAPTVPSTISSMRTPSAYAPCGCPLPELTTEERCKKKKLPTLNQKPDSAARLEVTYSLNVLESTDEELHQTSYNSLIAQRSVIGRTQSQIANQSNQSCQQIRSMESVKVNRVTTLYL